MTIAEDCSRRFQKGMHCQRLNILKTMLDAGLSWGFIPAIYQPDSLKTLLK